MVNNFLFCVCVLQVTWRANGIVLYMYEGNVLMDMLFYSAGKYSVGTNQYTYLNTYIALYFVTPKLPENTRNQRKLISFPLYCSLPC